MLVTKSECQSAAREVVRLSQLRDRLTKRLAQEQAWEGGLKRDEREFEEMRLQAQEDLAWEFVDHLPVGEELRRLEEAGLLKSVPLKKIEMAYGISKGLLQSGRGVATTDDRKRTQLIIDGNRELRKVIESVAGPARKTLEAMDKVLTAGAKSAAVAGYWSSMDTRERAKFAVSIAEVFAPEVVGPLALGENLSERWVQNRAAQVALTSLREAQSGNWNARRYLSDRIARVDEALKLQQVTVDKYRMPLNGIPPSRLDTKQER